MSRELHARPASLLVRLLDEGSPAALPDAQLVDRFVATRDPEAFAALVARHGPLVMGTCRGVLGGADAEDAFQATFLVLLNRMGTFAVGASLAGWLHRVARRVARQARREQARRRRREEAAAPRRDPEPEPDPGRTELLDVIRQEVDRLPERYRAPVVLCDLEGLTREQAAAVLGCSAGTVGGRLARARRRLRDGLERRGVDPSSAVPIPLAPAAWRSALEAASRSAASLAAGVRPAPSVAALAARAAAPWLPIKSAVAMTVAAFFAGGLLAAAGPSQPPPEPTAPQAAAPARDTEPAPFDPDDPKEAGRFAGRVVDEEDRPVAGAQVFIARQPREGSPDAIGPARARTGPDGRFDFEAPDMTYEGADRLPLRRQGLLVAAAEGYAPDWILSWGETRSTFHTHFDPIKGAALTLRLVRDVPIRGRIVDPEGRPIAGARVRLQSLEVAERASLDRMLKPPASPFDAFMGPCHTRSLGRPELLPGVAGTVATDADGRFRLAGLGGERIARLVASAPGFEDEFLTVVTREVPAVEPPPGRPLQAARGADFTARLKPDRTVAVSGVVRDRETGEPLAGVRVGRIWLGESRDASGDPDSVVTGPDGRFTVRRIRPEELAPPPPPNAMGFPNGPFRLAAVPAPGSAYLPASVVVDRREGLVIECVQGVPFRLKVVDEAGRPVDGEVTAFAVTPNPWLESLPPGAVAAGDRPAGRASRKALGVYEGVAAFGPGAILVKTPDVRNLRPPSLDPKAFFAPGKADWTDLEIHASYGDRDTLILGPSWHRQDDYAAIVLIDPQPGSGRLDLSATVFHARPRPVTFLDPEGRPLIGVVAEGLTCIHDVGGPPLRAATVDITRLDPERPRRITFVHEGRKLIASLLARDDGDAPYTVTLRPWATVTGRIVAADGTPFDPASPTAKSVDHRSSINDGSLRDPSSVDDPETGRFPDVQTDHEGRFRVERLIPGLRYTAEVYRNQAHVGTVLKDLVLQPGEVREIGDVRTGGP